MTSDLVNSIAKYTIALVVIIGAFVLIYQGRGDQVQPWTVIGLVVGWIIRDSSGTAATTNAVKTMAASQPAGTVIGTATAQPVIPGV